MKTILLISSILLVSCAHKPCLVNPPPSPKGIKCAVFSAPDGSGTVAIICDKDNAIKFGHYHNNALQYNIEAWQKCGPK
jgi:hypothetical protein